METDFSRADLRNVNFSYVFIADNDFTGADLRGAKFDRACDLESNIWTEAVLDPKWANVIDLLDEGMRSGQDLHGVDLGGVCITENALAGINFSQANLSNANLLRAFCWGGSAGN